MDEVSSNSQQGSECIAIPIEQEDNSESSTPFLHSRFLCPSNLGALLESTTVSLVSGGWKEASVGETENESSSDVATDFVEDPIENAEDTLKLEDAASTTTEEAQVQDLSSFPCVDAAKLPQQSDLPQLIPPVPFTVTPPLSRLSPLPTPPLPHLSPLPTPPPTRLSPLPTPHTTLGETHMHCCSDVDLHRHHQLCIAIDEDGPVKYTPSFFRNQSCGSQKSSACSSLATEGEVPGIARHEHRTHSRNVSETPSLPPFHSSSTSSAYHSRNSSLGSQFSSCFESDSMLNQLTDMDSCLAVQNGSSNDLKQLIRKQDSRFCRRGDSSPSSYSSDLSLHQHMSKPLDRKEAVLNMSPLNLEDTLRNLSSEKLDQCRRNVAMKSSEWIKHQLESHRDSLVIVKVSSKTKHVVHFNVKAGDIIIWEFATKKKDIAFGVFFEATEVATEQSPVPDSHGSRDNKMSSILPIFRVNTHAHPTVGTHIATLDGIYEIIFDNTYSRFFAKELYYKITTQPSQPNSNYSQQ